ncbi:MAG TPA: acetyl-CoA carboxylase biotin carboxylase subunit [Geminicoccus sp.]|uniref:acetyl-CoA carboxylase biotin carboxylase subunit n=1 Tax=Geminicoccus sp. TaxID=2024832 RepID=UPI002E33FD60|nr:acetyl-CoA carboxylase biotin carboxylase subunit [Geminicoccus sp.]HEX2527786.1 acetyl-CoA carboxylase biotin carboxylase subunit [Geminicoccus sp.]
MFKKILIANRGEIAVRVLRACREMGIQTVAVHSTADASAMHVRFADESVCIGPPQVADSYLNKLSILAAAEITGAEAIHPGYGFLSENADFCQMVEEHGFAFIGPTPEHIRLMGDKIVAKDTARRLGIPCVPGTDGPVGSEEEAFAAAEEIGWPVLIKAVSGGGGRGMTVVRDRDQLLDALSMARGEAKAGFGDDRVYIEKYLAAPRHIEVQVLCDTHGQVLHLGERDCSLQRRHQKVVEEAPSPVLDAADREKLGALVAKAMAKFGYRGAGTLEFLYEDGQFYFIEMNTRLQVEHPVTEAVTRIDLVREQIRVAAGEKLAFSQEDVVLSGHAIECRITAENPKTLAPSPGRVTGYHAPGGPGVRMDSALYAGYTIPPYYDSLIAKLIVHDVDRPTCLRRLERALAECVIEGVDTNLPLLRAVLGTSAFKAGQYDTGWLGKFIADWEPPVV